MKPGAENVGVYAAPGIDSPIVAQGTLCRLAFLTCLLLLFVLAETFPGAPWLGAEPSVPRPSVGTEVLIVPSLVREETF